MSACTACTGPMREAATQPARTTVATAGEAASAKTPSVKITARRQEMRSEDRRMGKLTAAISDRLQRIERGDGGRAAQQRAPQQQSRELHRLPPAAQADRQRAR